MNILIEIAIIINGLAVVETKLVPTPHDDLYQAEQYALELATHAWMDLQGYHCVGLQGACGTEL